LPAGASRDWRRSTRNVPYLVLATDRKFLLARAVLAPVHSSTPASNSRDRGAEAASRLPVPCPSACASWLPLARAANCNVARAALAWSARGQRLVSMIVLTERPGPSPRSSFGRLLITGCAPEPAEPTLCLFWHRPRVLTHRSIHCPTWESTPGHRRVLPLTATANDAPRVERQSGDLLTLGPTRVKLNEEVPRTCTCHAMLHLLICTIASRDLVISFRGRSGCCCPRRPPWQQRAGEKASRKTTSRDVAMTASDGAHRPHQQRTRI
jgi:hypothetical protein